MDVSWYCGYSFTVTRGLVYRYLICYVAKFVSVNKEHLHIMYCTGNSPRCVVCVCVCVTGGHFEAGVSELSGPLYAKHCTGTARCVATEQV